MEAAIFAKRLPSGEPDLKRSYCGVSAAEAAGSHMRVPVTQPSLVCPVDLIDAEHTHRRIEYPTDSEAVGRLGTHNRPAGAW